MDSQVSETFFQKRRQLVLQQRQKNRQSVFQRTRKLFKDISNPIQAQDDNSQSQESQSLPIEEQIQLQLKGIQMVDEKNENTHEQTPTKKNSKKKSPCGSYAEMMQVPDWLIEIPQNFDKFLIAALPAFKKCLIFFKSKNIVIRDKLGKLVAKFCVNSKNYRQTVFECYFDEKTKTILVSDLISWKGNFMTDNPFNFRLAWITSNFNPKNLSDEYHFKILPYFQNNLLNLQQVYENDLGYPKEGLIFFHQQAFYEHGLNTNMLLWKDLSISYSLKNDPQYLKHDDIYGLGRLARNGNVYSLDKVKIGAIPQCMTKKNKGFVRFSFQKLTISEIKDETLNVQVDQIEILKLQGYYLKYADPISKIVFGYMLKHKPLEIKDIANVFKK